MSEMRPSIVSASEDLLARTDLYRAEAFGKLDPVRRTEMGQFLTPSSVSRLMASMFAERPAALNVLDAGAGVGSLSAALVAELCKWDVRPEAVTMTAYEIEPVLLDYLRSTLGECASLCIQAGVRFDWQVLDTDFIATSVEFLAAQGTLLPPQSRQFNCAIANPPYRKINSDSRTRRLLRSVGIETTNLYTAFMWLISRLLDGGGELVSITPRSFCNGPYYRPFRIAFLQAWAIRRIHVFESRQKAFAEADVLQENIILHAVKGGQLRPVVISASEGPDDEYISIRHVDYDQVVHQDDPDRFIHMATGDTDQSVRDRLAALSDTLSSLNVEVSTGRVVDFRAKGHLRPDPAPDTVPLIYPTHLDRGFVHWPRLGNRKPNALAIAPATQPLLLPNGWYVLVKRFTAKEEPRRVVAALNDPARIAADQIGFENHLDVFHRGGRGLPADLAKGLAIYLNSTLLDTYVRQFSGHTQVNATDLRALRYPSEAILMTLGARVGDHFPSQNDIDTMLEEEVQRMADIQSANPVTARNKIREAMDALRAVGMPRAQLNERSALTLLALLDLRPETPWAESSDRPIGITPIMDYCAEHYGKTYAPNTRETVRRQTMHQFVEAGLVIANPDEPYRPVNSPKTCYQIEPRALELLRSVGSPQWAVQLQSYLAEVPSLKERYARIRSMEVIPATLADGKEVYLTPGEHNELTRAIVESFAPRFAPGAHVLYVGDTGDKWAHFDQETLASLGVSVDVHGKMPDVVIYHAAKGWLLLVEAVTSHGPVNPKRRNELARLFETATPALIYVTAFLTRTDMARYLSDISWETEVWVAESEDHLIHFDGEKFLGPYKT